MGIKTLQYYATGFYFPVLDQKKIQNLIWEGGKKTFRKKNIPPIFGKGYEGNKKKTLDKFLEKLMRVIK